MLVSIGIQNQWNVHFCVYCGMICQITKGRIVKITMHYWETGKVFKVWFKLMIRRNSSLLEYSKLALMNLIWTHLISIKLYCIQKEISYSTMGMIKHLYYKSLASLVLKFINMNSVSLLDLDTRYSVCPEKIKQLLYLKSKSWIVLRDFFTRLCRTRFRLWLQPIQMNSPLPPFCDRLHGASHSSRLSMPWVTAEIHPPLVRGENE